MTIHKPILVKKIVGVEESGIEVQAYRVGFSADGPEECWIETTAARRPMTGDPVDIIVISPGGVPYRTEAIMFTDKRAWIEGLDRGSR